MPEGCGPQDMLALWHEGQRAFWSAAGAKPAFADASAFAPEGLDVFDSWAEALLRGTAGSESAGAVRASARYRDVVLACWGRIRQAFETHRRAIYDPNAPLTDWRLLRDRWFQIAEAEFIQLMQSEAFLDAQRGVIRAAIDLWPRAPEALRDPRARSWRAPEAVSAMLDTTVPIAQTPRKTVWTEGKTTLSRYEPLGHGGVALGPVLICHGLIGRQSMIDLRPDRSLVRNLLAAGVDVFVIDWGDAGAEDSGLGLDHFAGRHLSGAIRAALEASGADDLVLFGICQGGTLAAIHMASRPKGVRGLITAVAPFDFHADTQDADPAHGLLNIWVRSLDVADLEGLIGLEGNLSGELMGLIFNQLNPVRTLEKYLIRMVDAAGDPGTLQTFAAMERWLADRPDLPGALARTWLVDLYRENALAEGKLRFMGDPVDLGRINVPVLNVVASADHIVPPPCSRALGRLVGKAPYRELSMPTGHIGTFVSARAQVLLPPAITSFLAETRNAPFPPH